MNLPSDFINTITSTFGEEGENLISNLPALIDEASVRWGLTDVQPVPMLSYNFVAFAKRRGEVISPGDVHNEEVGQGDPAPTEQQRRRMCTRTDTFLFLIFTRMPRMSEVWSKEYEQLYFSHR
jgi:hypothetical protein